MAKQYAVFVCNVYHSVEIFKHLCPFTVSVEKAEQRLADKGRVLLRKSGTEPLVRVMVEGEEQALVKELAQNIADVIVKQSQS